jgi:hypothetical protein
MGRIVCTQTDKNARRQAPANIPRNSPFRPRGQAARWATVPTSCGGYPSGYLSHNEASAPL